MKIQGGAVLEHVWERYSLGWVVRKDPFKGLHFKWDMESREQSCSL